MKILHICKNSLPDIFGGVEVAVAEMCRIMTELGHEVEVVSTTISNSREGYISGCPVKFFHSQLTVSSTPISFGLIKYVYKVAHEFDLIFLHYPFPTADLALLNLGQTRKLIIIYHADIIRKNEFLRSIYWPLRELTFAKAKIIITTNDEYRKSSLQIQRHSHKCQTITLAIDDPANKTQDQPLCNFDFEKPYFLFVGRMRKYKSLMLLAQAARDLPCELVLVGTGHQEAELKEYIKVHGINNLHCIGEIPEEQKRYCYQHALGVVLPSSDRSEALGLTLIEGLAFGKPLICCRLNTGTTFVNIDNETGIVIPPHNANALRKAMLTILGNPTLADQMGQNSRKRYDKFFSLETMKCKYRQLLAKSI